MMRYLFYISVPMLLFLTNCNKREFLSASPSSNFEAPSSLTHLAGLLNNEILMAETPILGEQSADDYYLTDEYYKGFLISPMDQRIYTWERDIFSGAVNIPDWNWMYAQVLNTNIVLESLKKIKSDVSTQTEWNRIKGSALFMRSFTFFNLSQVFAPPYDATTTDKPNGIVLVLSSDNGVVYSRSTMKESYDRIIEDLVESTKLLPVTIEPQIRNRPNKAAAFALLARVCLSMRNYDKAGEYADSCLKYQSTLIDFNILDLSQKIPVPRNNVETLYQSNLISTSNVIQGISIQGCIIDSVLYNSFDTNDLRRKVFFMPDVSKKLPIFRSNYAGSALAFSGMAIDEVLLIRAECNAIKGKTADAIADINHLLEKRYRTGSFIPYPLSLSNEETIKLVRSERRKELVFRGLRWSDLRRYNKEEAKITIRRKIAGTEFKLLPNDSKYVLPIPDDARWGSNIGQNPRF